MISLSTQRLRAAAAFAVIFAGLTSAASAQAPYPNRNITLVLPFAAGSGTDTTTRLISKEVGTALGVEHGDRKQGRRQRLDRRELCRPLGAGRLHAVRDDQYHALGKSIFAEDHELRSGQGFHADRADRRPALHAGDPSRRSRKLGGRTDRAGQEGARQVVLCQRQFVGERFGRDIRPPRRHRYAARSLQEFAAGPDRRDRRPRLHDVHRRSDRAAPRQRQGAEGDCGHHQTALGAAAAPSDHGPDGKGFRHHLVAGLARSGQYAEGDGHQAERGNPQGRSSGRISRASSASAAWRLFPARPKSSMRS